MNTGRAEKVSFSHYKIHTNIMIDAAPDVVWAALTDTANYKSWAEFLVGIDGAITDGATITTVFQLDPKKNKFNRLDHTIAVVEGQEFFWEEKGPGGIRDNHHFKVEPVSDGKTRFTQSDEIMGGMTFLIGSRLAKTYLDGYQAFNRGLKAEVERRSHVS